MARRDRRGPAVSTADGNQGGAMAFCASCGKEVPAGAAFCAMCGAPVRRPPIDSPPPALAPAPAAPFSIKEAVACGWKAMQDHLGLFLGCELFFFGVIVFFELAVKLVSPESSGAPSAVSVLLFCAGIFTEYTVTLGLYSLILTLHDGRAGRFDQLFSRAGQFFPYLGMVLLKGIVVLAGLILLVVPGIYWLICFLFSSLSLVDKRLGPIDAMRRSAALTRGHRWKLFLFGLLLLLINLGGALCLLVGLLFTVPASWMAMVFAYRRLEELSAPLSPAPIPSAPPDEGVIPR
jgi:hypothetical protein